EFALTTSHLHGDRDTERFALGVLARMGHAQCDLEGAYDLCRRLHRMGREEGNLRMVASSQMAMAHLEFNRGNAERARELAARSDALLRRVGYRELGVLLGVTLMLVEHSTGNLGRAAEIGAEVHAWLEDVPLSAVGARVHPRLATQLAWQGAFDDAAEHVAIGRAKAVEASVAREHLMVRQSEAGLLDARGDTAGAAEAYGALYRDARQGELTMLTALIALRLGGLHVRLGQVAQAREALDAALAIAEPCGLRTVVAEGQVWRELLPGGQPATGRVVLEREQAVIPAHARVRLWRLLGERLEEPALIAKARALCERLLASAPEAQRERMRRDVPLYRDTLA
ncbi:MAG: hypothetical protein P1V36_14060, partial [Planctomycetota bacterium]|nr:hypothetical protein [Planctomycetota bacterium]